MIKHADRIDRIELSGIRKINETALQMEREGAKIIHFEIGRPDFDTPQYIKDEAIRSLQAGDVCYTSNLGKDALRTAVAEYLNNRIHTHYTGKNILIAVGLSEAIYDLFFTLLNEGDEILVPDPAWMNYINIPKIIGAKAVPYALREANGFQIDPDEIESLITDKTKAILINTPGNPTGGVAEKAVLQRIADIAIEKDLLVLTDEIYERLIYEGEHVSIASLPDMEERTIVLNGFSKSYAMTGWRLGYMAGPEEWVGLANRLHQNNVTCAPSFVQQAGIIALKNETTEVEDMVAEYKRRRDYIVDYFKDDPNVHCIKPHGTFYILFNISKLPVSDTDIIKYMLMKKHVAVVYGSVFGNYGGDYIRLSFASSLEDIKEGCKRLKEGFQELADGASID